jgi:DNA-binding transcriptional MerR regulator
MEYSVNKLTKLSGVSARTLRYYDEIGLLKPVRVASSGYRFYGRKELDVLQQILFFRELDFPLEEIKKLLTAPGFDREHAFQSHLSELRQKRERLDALINNVTKSIANMKGEIEMPDAEKFEGFKKRLWMKTSENMERKSGKSMVIRP